MASDDDKREPQTRIAGTGRNTMGLVGAQRTCGQLHAQAFADKVSSKCCTVLEGAAMSKRPTVGPFRVESHDCEGGAIAYEVWDYFTGTYHRLCAINDFDNPHAKHDAELIANSLNTTLQLGIPARVAHD